MKLTPRQLVLIDRELPIIELDNELQFRILQRVLWDWNKSNQYYLCFRIIDAAYDHIDELVQNSTYANFNRAALVLRGKIGLAIDASTILTHLINRAQGQIYPEAIKDNAAIIRHRWVIKILLANRERLGIKLEG